MANNSHLIHQHRMPSSSQTMPSPIPSSDMDAIRNVLATYCVALDTKHFDRLKYVFTANIHASYPFADFNGTRSMVEDFTHRFEHVTSQHALTTQTIELLAHGHGARAETYFTAVYFGQGVWEGQKVVFWGKFVDDLVKSDQYGRGGGTRDDEVGNWRVMRRVCEVVGQEGDERGMEGGGEVERIE
ncbi:hypothetical protein TI39_contig4311g00002 [Zymoseptoria brevis]|uniref:SnoaL-like domain-containing protein n=1 Tax=Zymoseptoria brevis TaxID=1047168 RepID=A0A0F4GBA2_9PEZI|nr:hypothetical protein TI39_contig4311g00002 [Zymoseptoria brevis]